MTKTITFNELRKIKDALPHGSMAKIAEELGLDTDTVRNYFGGTHAPGMAKYITGRTTLDGSGRDVTRNYKDFNIFGTYLTTKDQGVEINFDTQYKVYENLRVDLELGYIHLWLDKGTWGGYENYVGNTLNSKDAWKATVNVIYTF